MADEANPGAAIPTVGGALVRGISLLLLAAVYVVFSRLMIVRATWLLVVMGDLAMFVGWLVLVVRAGGALARALGAGRAVHAALIRLGAVAILMPLLVSLLWQQPLFFWWNRALFDEAAEKAEAGEFQAETRGHHTMLRLPAPYDDLAQGAQAWVVKDGERSYIVFPQSALAGEFNGYCRVLDGPPPTRSCTSKPVRGGRGVWFKVDRG